VKLRDFANLRKVVKARLPRRRTTQTLMSRRITRRRIGTIVRASMFSCSPPCHAVIGDHGGKAAR
jgi:hypothetical protein